MTKIENISHNPAHGGEDVVQGADSSIAGGGANCRATFKINMEFFQKIDYPSTSKPS